MGISNANVTLLLAARQSGIHFGRTATLGKQTFWPTEEGMRHILPHFGIRSNPLQFMSEMRSDGDLFLRRLGATEVISFDANSYEGANVIHDMNELLPAQWNGHFDLLYDGGCLQHIFDVRQALENITNMIKIGGTFVGSTTANNLLGVGFYQFSPELFFRFFSRENGWQTLVVLLCEHQLHPPRFWAVTDPQHLGRRIQIQNSDQLYIMVIARKCESVARLVVPQDSAYSARWVKAIVPAPKPVAPQAWLGFVSGFLRNQVRRWRHKPSNQPESMTQRAKGLSQQGLCRLTYADLSRGLLWRDNAAD